MKKIERLDEPICKADTHEILINKVNELIDAVNAMQEQISNLQEAQSASFSSGL